MNYAVPQLFEILENTNPRQVPDSVWRLYASTFNIPYCLAIYTFSGSEPKCFSFQKLDGEKFDPVTISAEDLQRLEKSGRWGGRVDKYWNKPLEKFTLSGIEYLLVKSSISQAMPGLDLGCISLILIGKIKE